MRTLAERAVRVLTGAAGLVFGILSGAVLAVVAVVGPLIGAASLVLFPFRSLFARLRRRSSARAAGARSQTGSSSSSS